MYFNVTGEMCILMWKRDGADRSTCRSKILTMNSLIFPCPCRNVCLRYKYLEFPLSFRSTKLTGATENMFGSSWTDTENCIFHWFFLVFRHHLKREGHATGKLLSPINKGRRGRSSRDYNFTWGSGGGIEYSQFQSMLFKGCVFHKLNSTYSIQSS